MAKVPTYCGSPTEQILSSSNSLSLDSSYDSCFSRSYDSLGLSSESQLSDDVLQELDKSLISPEAIYNDSNPAFFDNMSPTWDTKVYHLHYERDVLPNVVEAWLAWEEQVDPDKMIEGGYLASFDEVMTYIRHHGQPPSLINHPGLLYTPELCAYPWRIFKFHHNLRYTLDDLEADQRLFERVALATFRTDRKPLCCPDYLFVDDKARGRIKEDAQWQRDEIPPLDQAKHFAFLATISGPARVPLKALESRLPTGEHLQQQRRSGIIEFARRVVELGQVEVSQEVASIMQTANRPVVLPLAAGQGWSAPDELAIIGVAQRYWDRWRAGSEEMLTRGPYEEEILESIGNVNLEIWD
ncbi:hypothetical protein BT63DRAFT_456570 [Microthyrium microscopicum]|uniref:Uncharacterized protein n=1 Tax=Microthyrium microscopicum TaxID=703497 RepID=A0A6A6U5R8_9PEZI|nr:hypothetical protein BT63DRAFT_456570 [Microthyrium microscopicum]